MIKYGYKRKNDYEEKQTYRLAVTLAVLIVISSIAVLSGCGQNQSSSENKATSDELYFANQEVRPSPEWVKKLDAAKDAEQMIVIADFDYAYQYVLNMGYNSECEVQKGFAFFFHSFRVNRPYTGGCVAVPESIMKFVMQHIKPGCKFTIDSLEHFGGDLDA